MGQVKPSNTASLCLAHVQYPRFAALLYHPGTAEQMSFHARLGACQTEATATVVSSDDSLDLERKRMPPLPCWGCTSSLSSLPQPCRYHQTTFSAQYTVQALGTGPTMARFRWRFQGAYLYLHWVAEGAGRICSWDLDMGLIAWQLSRQRLRAAACLT